MEVGIVFEPMPYSPVPRARVLQLLPAVATTIALGSLIGGVFFFYRRFSNADYPPLAGLLLIAAGLLQARLAWRLFCQSSAAAKQRAPWRLLMRGLLVSAVVSYAVAILFAPRPGTEFVFAAALSSCCTVLLLPLAATPQTLEGWRKLIESRTPRKLGWLVYTGAVLLTAAELGLRGFEGLTTSDPLGQPSASHGVHTAATAPKRPGVFRVVILGDEKLTSGPKSSLAGLTDVPGLEVQVVATGRARSKLTGCMLDEVAARGPDLVLALVSVADDFGPKQPEPGLFDPRGLRVVKLGGQLCSTSLAAADEERSETRMESAGDALRHARQLEICRTPISQDLHGRWSLAFNGFDRLAAACRERSLPLGLVVVPGDFQTNAVLRDTLRRRLGYEASMIDLSLPQRRISAYAASQGLAMLDLLPHLKRGGDMQWAGSAEPVDAPERPAAASALLGWIGSRHGAIAATQLTTKQ